MPSSATWDGQLTSPGVVDPWSPKPAPVPVTDPWGLTAAAAAVPQTHPAMSSTVNDPWSATSASVTTSQWFELKFM